MKKFFIVLAVLLLGGAGYFTYEKWVKHANINSWSFVPSDAAIVLETKLLNDYQSLKEYAIWKTLNETTGFSKIEKRIQFLDSINGQGGFSAIFKDVPVLISGHKVSSDDLDFLFVVNIQNISQNTFVGAVIGRLQKNGYRFKTRNYNGFKISEISKDGESFTCIFYRNYLLASFTPYLVEDAIRTISEEGFTSYEDRFLTIVEPRAPGLLNIYVNYGQFDGLLSGFTENEVSIPLRSGNYTASLDSTFISVSGFTYPEEGWFTTHKRQPAGFDMAEIVPENTAFMYHIASSDISNWKQRQMDYLRSFQPVIARYQDSLQVAFDFYADQVLDLVDEEIGIITLESGSVRSQKRFCILEVKNMTESLDFFERVTERIALSRGDSVYSESYSDNEIRFLPIRNFPSTILGELSGSFDQCFYISYRNYLIFSNDLLELKNLIKSIQDENTWGKSLHMNEFLERTNNAANVSLFINTPRAWAQFEGKASETWAEHIRINQSSYKAFELVALQFSYLDNRFFTNFTASQPLQRPRSIPKTDAETDVRFASNLITKPYLVKTHAHKDLDLMVQDSSQVLYYLDKNQNAQWSQELNARIVSEIFPVDYYKNGKLQYAFATTTHIHIWDRTGEPIPEYPKSLPGDVEIQHFNVLDYDLSRNYRFAVTDINGNIFLTNKDAKPLEGWAPRRFDRKALAPLTHYRLGRTDVMLSIQENGIINVTNRRGENMRGFPFDTEQILDSNYFLRASNGLGNSSLSVISKGGELTEITLEGDVIKRDQLIKTSADATFRLIPDRSGQSFLIVRNEGNSYEVLDDTGNLLFKKNYLSNEPILIQYYQFGAGKDLVIFVDTANENLYIFNKSGNLVTGNPLRSSHEVSILYSSAKREFQVFTTSGSNLERYTFNY